MNSLGVIETRGLVAAIQSRRCRLQSSRGDLYWLSQSRFRAGNRLF